MATSEEDTLEIILNRATDPSQKEDDWDKIQAFCNKVNRELEGPLLSTRLLAHKIQSPQEREAILALSTLEACVNECGRYFHQEIGKFRFLNEMIKVVSPKYLGNRTSEKVKTRCIEILYSWNKGLIHEPKIAEAYRMLKAQGIIKEDPTYVDKIFTPYPPPKPRKADFEDDEKAKTLERLLKSKNPEDLQAANRLIKNMVKEDIEKTEKKSRRINELESVANQVKLLSEMISHFSTTSSSKEEKEMMKELFDNLEKQRPNLFRLASDTEENDNEGINEILTANDSVTRVMTLYKQTVEGVAPTGDYSEGAGAQDSSLLDMGFDSGMKKQSLNTNTNGSSSSALLENDFKNLGLGDMNDLGSIFSNTSGTQQQATSTQMGQSQGMTMQGNPFAFGQQGFIAPSMGFPQGPPPVYNGISHSIGSSSASSLSSQNTNPFVNIQSTVGGKESTQSNSSLADLDILSKSLQDYNLPKETFPDKVVNTKIPLNQMALAKTLEKRGPSPTTPQSITVGQVLQPSKPAEGLLQPSKPAEGLLQPSKPAEGLLISTDTSLTDFAPMVSATPEPKVELLPLTDVFVPLEKIQPAAGVSPVTAYEKNSLKVVIHIGKDRPRADVQTMVVSTLSTNSSPISAFVFQAAVPKTMKVKLQSPSASDFPAYNPILPPTAITQVMHLANPRKEKVRLKYKLSYMLDGNQVSDVGDIDGIPCQ